MSSSFLRSSFATLCVTGAAVASLGLAVQRSPVNTRRADTAPPATVQLTMATLHAATLSKSRSAHDSTDAPFLLVTILGKNAAQTSLQMPSPNSHWTIHQDEAKGAAPLTSLSIAAGDSVRVLFTVLESATTNSSQDASVATALSKLQLNASTALSSATLASTIAPLTRTGAHLLGSATMLLTNEGGKTYWRALDCISACKVSNSPLAGNAESEVAAKALAAVVELNGNGAVYHLQFTARRSE